MDPLGRFRLDGRAALVTGASSGLGARFARVLASAGARVALAARRREPLLALAAELPGARAFPCDVCDAEQTRGLVEAAERDLGGIDVLVNCAGRAEGPVPAEEESLELFRRIVEVNQIAVFDLCRQVGPRMIARGGGSIVNVSSIHGLVASAPNDQAGYASSKAALLNLTRELAVQWARRGVRVNALAPGYFPTAATAAMLEGEGGRAWIERHTPMGRPGREDELDGALLFLASDASSYVTGATLVVDGGWTAR